MGCRHLGGSEDFWSRKDSLSGIVWLIKLAAISTLKKTCARCIQMPSKPFLRFCGAYVLKRFCNSCWFVLIATEAGWRCLHGASAPATPWYGAWCWLGISFSFEDLESVNTRLCRAWDLAVSCSELVSARLALTYWVFETQHSLGECHHPSWAENSTQIVCAVKGC